MDRNDHEARTYARTPSPLKQMEEQAAEARRLFDRLLDAAADQRMALAAGGEYRNLRLADLLLEESLELQPAEPLLSEELAALGFQIAMQSYEPGLASRVDDAKARASVLIGGARRLAGDRAGAEEAFRCAVTYLTCPPNALERGFYCQQLASLRRDQGRDDEATGLLWRAALIYNESSDLLEEGACLAELGFLFVADDQVHRAVLPLTRACEVLDLHRDATLAVLARLALAVCHARLGEADKAQRILKAARAMYDRVSDSSRQLAHVTWMEGKVAAFTANLEDAPGLLDTARKAFVQQGRLYATRPSPGSTSPPSWRGPAAWRASTSSSTTSSKASGPTWGRPACCACLAPWSRPSCAAAAPSWTASSPPRPRDSAAIGATRCSSSRG